MSVPNFYAIFELYCPASGTFFTPIHELALALPEMWEVSNLPKGSLPYEKYFPRMVELEQLEKEDPVLFETYRELVCHFYIRLDVHNARGNVSGLKVWADYVFPILEDAPEKNQFPVTDEDITRVMTSSEHGDSSWEKTMESMRRVISSRAFITR